MTDLRTFAGRIKVVGKRVEDNADRLTRKVALAVDAAVVIATPVDTGRARSNWQVSLGEAASGTREAFSEGKDRSTESANTQAALEEGKAVISEYKGGTDIHITNNLPYIGRLNEGWSAQAPSAFVEKAVLVGVAAVQGAGGLLQNAIKEEL